MRDQGDYISYKSELKQRLNNLLEKEKEAYSALNKEISDENINALNNIQMDIQIIQSRIDNYGKDRGGLEERTLPKIQNL